MTLQEALARIDETRPGEVGQNTLVKWLSDLDGQIYEEVVKTHEGLEDTPHGPYSVMGGIADGDDDGAPGEDIALMIRDPYSELYIHHLMANIDYQNGELDRYNNETARFNTLLSSYINWINRNYMPKQANFVRF